MPGLGDSVTEVCVEDEPEGGRALASMLAAWAPRWALAGRPGQWSGTGGPRADSSETQAVQLWGQTDLRD